MSQVTLEKTPDYLVIKIPLKAVENGYGRISSRSQKIIDEAVSEGLEDIKTGRTFGPFRNIREFKLALKRRT